MGSLVLLSLFSRQIGGSILSRDRFRQPRSPGVARLRNTISPDSRLFKLNLFTIHPAFVRRPCFLPLHLHRAWRGRFLFFSSFFDAFSRRNRFRELGSAQLLVPNPSSSSTGASVKMTFDSSDDDAPLARPNGQGKWLKNGSYCFYR